MSTPQIAHHVGSSRISAFRQVSALVAPLMEGTVRAFLPAVLPVPVGGRS